MLLSPFTLTKVDVHSLWSNICLEGSGNNSPTPPPLNTNGSTNFKELSIQRKKMVETISHMSFSPLLNKTALCEIKAYTFKGDNGMSEKGAPLWRHQDPSCYFLMIAASFSYHKAQRQSPLAPNTKENSSDHLMRGRDPLSPENQNLPQNWGFVAVRLQ